MPLSCFRSSDPHVRKVTLLYYDHTEEGHLWFGEGEAPLCSSTSPPLPSSCVVCFDRSVHAVCSDLMKDMTLTMEGEGHIGITDSACPRLLGDDAWPWWLWFFIFLLIFSLIFIIISVVCCKRRKSNRATPEQDLEGNTSKEPVADAAD